MAVQKLFFQISMVCFLLSCSWLLLNPFISISKGFQKPSLITTKDKSIPPTLETNVSKDDLDYSISLQEQLCEMDHSDFSSKLDTIESQFHSIGLSFNRIYGDHSFTGYNNQTSFDRLPTLVYGVWHPSQSTESPSSIILSTEINLNSTANSKATLYTTDCSYSIPSALSSLLSIVHSIQQSGRVNHDIVLAVHVNKYNANTNSVLQQKDIHKMIENIHSPLFSLHVEYPGSIISFSHIIEGFDLFSSGMNGKNANLDLVSTVLNHLPILSYEGSYSSFIQFGRAAIGRSFGLHQFYLLNNIPAVRVVARVRPATLKQRTLQGREKSLFELLTALKTTIEVCSSVEEQLDQNYMNYIPIVSSTPSESRFIAKSDIYIPCLLLLLAVFFLLISFNQLKKPTKVSGIYLGLLILVQGFYLILARLMNYCEDRAEVNAGLAVFVVYLIFYSSWLYYRLIYNNAMVSFQVCTEEEYKREVFSTCGLLTLLSSCLYFFSNPYLIIFHLFLLYLFLFLLLVFANQTARYCLLYAYSTLLAIPFLLIIRDDLYNWSFELLLTVRSDYSFIVYIMVVIIGNLAILHYVNGLSFVHLEDDEEEKLKQD